MFRIVRWRQFSGVRGGGGAAALPAWKIQGKLCLQGKLKLLKNPER